MISSRIARKTEDHSNIYFNIIADTIDCDWTKLAQALDHTIDIDDIDKGNRQYSEKSILFLQRWHQRNNLNSEILHTLSQALDNINRKDIFDLIGLY